MVIVASLGALCRRGSFPTLAYGFVEDAQLTIVMVVLVLTAFEFTLFADLLCGGFTDGIRSRYIDASWRPSALDVHDDPVTDAASMSRRQAPGAPLTLGCSHERHCGCQLTRPWRATRILIKTFLTMGGCCGLEGLYEFSLSKSQSKWPTIGFWEVRWCAWWRGPRCIRVLAGVGLSWCSSGLPLVQFDYPICAWIRTP